jgi:hypothetical protein
VKNLFTAPQLLEKGENTLYPQGTGRGTSTLMGVRSPGLGFVRPEGSWRKLELQLDSPPFWNAFDFLD